jgi:hypothetical protein
MEASMSPRKKQSANAKKRRARFWERARRRRKSTDAHNIPSFCVSNDISEAYYYKLKREGRGPREIEFDGRIIITPEAEADWRREREAETAAANAAKGVAEAAA